MEIPNGKGKGRRTIKNIISRIRKENKLIRIINEPRRIPPEIASGNDPTPETERRTTTTNVRRPEENGNYLGSR